MRGPVAFVVCLCVSVFARAADDANVLWYARPAETWTEALPLGNGRLGAMVDAGEDDQIIYARRENGPGMSFRAQLQAVAEGGQVAADKQGLHVTGADAMTLLLAADSSYNGFDKSPSREGVDPAVQRRNDLAAAAAKPYEKLREDHVLRIGGDATEEIFSQWNTFRGKNTFVIHTREAR